MPVEVPVEVTHDAVQEPWTSCSQEELCWSIDAAAGMLNMIMTISNFLTWCADLVNALWGKSHQAVCTDNYGGILTSC